MNIPDSIEELLTSNGILFQNPEQPSNTRHTSSLEKQTETAKMITMEIEKLLNKDQDNQIKQNGDQYSGKEPIPKEKHASLPSKSHLSLSLQAKTDQRPAAH
ncbi:hypothetical protein CEXT_473911 [Caerostris extrusa]|uniref:Uncharacterized protein n=1 Tax=Caerostris extrusa TaxID=172846 RepID=A0AAV4XP74_CAEEX|nr:hypothetical protein CEXT_473911 [Caerostris extrusa]